MANGIAIGWQLGNYRDDMAEGLGRLAEAIHASGGRVAAQIAHAGARANPALFPEEGELWGPSAVADALTGNTPREMTRQDIRQAVLAGGAAGQGGRVRRRPAACRARLWYQPVSLRRFKPQGR
jgi:2,4-dienoyl-CoA reductase-like NADH-dependent reductase (Old Yellow Enzyme family)